MGAVLNTVYNNYLAAYSPRQLTKYDTHKKSELRSVYNSIVKLNKDAPWYLPTTNKDTQHYAVSLKENARELHNAIAQLGGLEQDSMFRKKSAYSTEKQKRPSFFKGAKAEFKKISWPDRQSTLKQSVAVVAISVVVGVIIAVLDYFIQYGVNFLTSL